MITDELQLRVRTAFGHIPTVEQDMTIGIFAEFLTDRTPMTVMVLTGAAGTGKTSLASAIVKALDTLQQKMVLLAPTGRAAKVFSLYAGHKAYTIHRRIYRQKTAGDLSVFNLNDNLHADTLFIVDEASMVSHGAPSTTAPGAADFGTGDLLDDLVRYVYSGRNCRLMLIGDSAQLPPVGEAEAPALQAGVLRGYGLRVHQACLTEVLRQSQESGVLWNATIVRRIIESAGTDGLNDANDAAALLPRLHIRGFADICIVPGDELIETLASSYSRVGIDETIVITRSNKRANIYNQGIRNSILDREGELTRGDQLMVVKNRYLKHTPDKPTTQKPTPTPSPREGSLYSSSLGEGSGHLSYGSKTIQSPLPWGGEGGGLLPSGGEGGGLPSGGEGGEPDFIANGDRCVVQRLRGSETVYGFSFAEATLTFPDYDDYELTCKVLLDTLRSEAPALTREQQEQLYQGVIADYADIPHKADRLKALKSDVYYNALQIKYGYAVTCHKAQGGQWAHVYIDQGHMTDDMLTPDYLHWLYTALTRATDRVYLINWPATQVGDE